MPLSAVELCAAALLKIGAQPIAAFEDDTAEAACARRLYPITRDALLGVHPWSFTLAQARLLPERERAGRRLRARLRAARRPPAHDLGRRRRPQPRPRLPRPGRAASWPTREEIVLNYQRRVDESELPAFFVPLLVTRLAAEFCIPLTEGSSRAMDLYRLAEAELRTRPADRQPAGDAAARSTTSP